MLNDLRGKRALITGASQGIGEAVARGLARYGTRVAIHYNSHEAQAEAIVNSICREGGEAHLVQGDLMDPQNAVEVVASAAAALSGLDILVNNAGGPVRRASLADVDDHLFNQVLNLNVRAVVMMSQAAVSHMRATGSGAIINSASYVARTGSPTALLYAGAKAFVSNVTKGMAKDLAPFNIRVNAVSPGVIMTPFHAASSTKEWLESARSTIPMGRLGTVEECVGIFLFLASQEMSGYITGQTIEVNGGQTMV